MGKEKRIGQGGALVGARDGSGGGRVSLAVVWWVSLDVVRWVRFHVVSWWREETTGDCPVDALGRLEEEIR